MKNKRSAARRTGGYSLVELLTVLGIAGVLAGVALPALDGLAQDSRRATVANELLRTFILARAEAARLGRNIVVCGIVDADLDGVLGAAERSCTSRDWSVGWFAMPWSDQDGDGRVDAAELGAEPLAHYFNPWPTAVRVLPGNFTATPQPGATILRPFGRRSSNGTITLCDTRGPAAARALIVSPSGRARVSGRRAGGGPLTCP